MSDKFNLFGLEAEALDDKYSTSVGVPQYLPSAECPSIFQLVDDRKYKELIHNIEIADISEDKKAFLRMAAARHLVFNYSKIADYYAHSDATMQDLMEQSALVILDIDDAIANGYVKLSTELEKIMLETGIPAKKR